MSDSFLPAPNRSNSPFEAIRRQLIAKLLGVKAPAGFGSFPAPSDFTAVVDHMREVAAIVDEWCAAIGHQVADNSSARVDQSLFRSPMTDAIDGNAMWEVEKQGESLIAEMREFA